MTTIKNVNNKLRDSYKYLEAIDSYLSRAYTIVEDLLRDALCEIPVNQEKLIEKLGEVKSLLEET
jgi:hypothetical protein